MKSLKLFVLLSALTALFAAGCGGGGGGAVVTAPTAPPPTDAKVITTTVTQNSVHVVTSIISPMAVSTPKTLGRRTNRVAQRAVQTVTDNLDSINGNVGDHFAITYTDEPSDDCVLNGALNGVVTGNTGTKITLSLGGTLTYTSCTKTPNLSMTVTNGTMVATASSTSLGLPIHFAFTGKTYTVDITYSAVAGGSGGTEYLHSEAYTGSDSLGNTFDFGYGYTSTGQNHNSYNRDKINGAVNNVTSLCYPADGVIKYQGSSTLANNIVINYTTPFTFNYTEALDTSGAFDTYDLTLGGGNVSFTTNTGYTGTLAVNADGSGSGTVSNAAGATVSTFSCATTGLCSVDYVDSTIPDEQFYITNIDEALAD